MPIKSNLISRFVIVTSVLLCACGGPVATSSTEVRSPDGSWIAMAQWQQWAGPGNAYDATIVYLKPANSSRAPVEILELSNQYTKTTIEMEWLSPTHLDVTYGENPSSGDHVVIDFQAVKCSGIDISTHRFQAPSVLGTMN